MATAFLTPANNIFTHLAADITDVATAMNVTSGYGASLPAVPFNLSLDDEIVNVTNVSTDTLTIVREAEGTTGAAHVAGTEVELRVTAKAVSDLNTAVNTLEADVPTYAATGDIRYASAPATGAILTIGATDTILSVQGGLPVWRTPANIMTDLSGQAGADFAMNTNKITGVTDPSSAQDVATKNYVDTTAVLDALFDAHTILYAVSDDTPAALAVAASRIVGRKASGNIAAMTGAETLALLTGANLDVGGFDVRGATVTADGLTSGRVVVAGASGVLSGDSDFTFSVDTLTVTKLGATTLTGTLTGGGNDITGVGTLKTALLTLTSDEIEEHGTNTDSGTLALNFNGYNGGTTRFRDVDIYNGKQTRYGLFDGSAARFTVDNFGATILQGTITLNGQVFDAGAVDVDITTTGLVRGLVVTGSNATGGSKLEFFHDHTTPDLNSTSFLMNIYGYDGNVSPAKFRWGNIRLKYNNITDGTEQALLEFQLATGGVADNLAATLNGAGALNLDSVLQAGAAMAATVAYNRFGATATGHSLASDDDLMIGGKLEVGGISYFDGTVYLAERASAVADIASMGQAWVKDDTPNGFWFTDDGGNDHPLSSSLYSLANTYISGSGTAGTDNTAQTVKTVVLPAGILHEVGDRIRIRVYFIGDTGGNITMTNTVNGVTIASATDGGGATWFMTETWLHYIDATHANIAEMGATPATGSNSAANVAGFDWTSAQNVDTDQDQVAGNHIVVFAIFMEVFPKGIA